MTRDKNLNRLETWKVRRVFDSIVGLKEGKWFVSPTQHSVSLESQMLESINSSEKRQKPTQQFKRKLQGVEARKKGYFIRVRK